ncbi:hypothetical protein HYX02_08050 [Candidatus Woesearchaeota archaeon]|nr:hypothetical protein [Candidatus Woesearchaeota archaeon]
MGLVHELRKSERYIDEVEPPMIDVVQNVGLRPRLDKMHLPSAIEERLRKMLHEEGRNGTGLFLPFDQISAEHGPGHTFVGEGVGDIRNIAKLVESGLFSGYVLHPGNARLFRHLFPSDVPLIYKIDGHITQPNPAGIQATVGSIDEAVKLGASAVGLTIYPGSEHIRSDLERAGEIIRRTEEAGLVSVVWAYPRGPGLSQADSLYWTHYAVAIASGLLGARIIKTKFPAQVSPENRDAYQKEIEKVARSNRSMGAYLCLEPKDKDAQLRLEDHVYRASLVVQAAPGSIVIFSGGPKTKEDPTDDLLNQTRIIMMAGGEGAIYGRNIWGTSVDKGLSISQAVIDVMRRPEFSRVPY